MQSWVSYLGRAGLTHTATFPRSNRSQDSIGGMTPWRLSTSRCFAGCLSHAHSYFSHCSALRVRRVNIIIPYTFCSPNVSLSRHPFPMEYPLPTEFVYRASCSVLF